MAPHTSGVGQSDKTGEPGGAVGGVSGLSVVAGFLTPKQLIAAVKACRRCHKQHLARTILTHISCKH
jgi:hypothetical protein